MALEVIVVSIDCKNQELSRTAHMGPKPREAYFHKKDSSGLKKADIPGLPEVSGISRISIAAPSTIES